MAKPKIEADYQPEELNKTPSGARGRGKWGKRLGITNPVARMNELYEEGQIKANDILQFSLEIEPAPTLVSRVEREIPPDAADKAHDRIKTSLSRSANKNDSQT